MIYVLYDDPCIDGFGSAFAFWIKYQNSATYLPVNRYKGPFEFPTPLQAEDEIYIIDTSFPRERLLEWKKICKVVLLDHHKSAQEELGDLDFCHFDMTKSGCVLAWEYVNKHYTDKNIPITVPKILLHIQDRDLWRFKLPETEAITAALFMKEKDFGIWNNYLWDNFMYTDLLLPGRALIEHKDQYVKERIAEVKLITNSLGDTVPLINATIYASELGDALCKKFPESPYAMIMSVTSLNPLKFKFSLRSRRVEGADVSKVAAKFGGGGHKEAASFSVSNLNDILKENDSGPR